MPTERPRRRLWIAIVGGWFLMALATAACAWGVTTGTMDRTQILSTIVLGALGFIAVQLGRRR